MDELRRLYEERRLDEAWERYQISYINENPAWHLYGALSAFRMGKSYEAKVTGLRGLQRSPEGGTLARLLFVVAASSREIGDTQTAIDMTEALFREWTFYPSERVLLEAPAMHNLALVYHQQGQYQRATDTANAAAYLFRQWGDDENYGRAVRNAAWSASAMGNTETAFRLLSEVEHLATGEWYWDHRIGLAYLAVNRNEFASCREICTEIIGSDKAPLDYRVQAMWVIGWAHLRLGRTDMARASCNLAHDLSDQMLDKRHTSEIGRLNAAITHAELEGA